MPQTPSTNALPDQPGPSGRNHAVYRVLRRAILDQSLTSGQKLTEESIAEQLQVSRTLVREAFMRLSAEGLVEIRPNRGAFVAQPTMQEARQTFVVRRGLERLVVSELTGRLTAEQIATLEAHVASEEAAQDRRESIRLAGDFHTLLVEMTGNALLIRFVREVSSRCTLILSIYGRPHSGPHAVDEHREIIHHLVSGDAEAAQEVMDRHLESVLSRALVPEDEGATQGSVLRAYAIDEGLLE